MLQRFLQVLRNLWRAVWVTTSIGASRAATRKLDIITYIYISFGESASTHKVTSQWCAKMDAGITSATKVGARGAAAADRVVLPLIVAMSGP